MPLNTVTDTDSNTRSCRPVVEGISGRARRDPYNANEPSINPSERGHKTGAKWDKAPRLGGLVPLGW